MYCVCVGTNVYQCFNNSSICSRFSSFDTFHNQSSAEYCCRDLGFGYFQLKGRNGTNLPGQPCETCSEFKALVLQFPQCFAELKLIVLYIHNIYIVQRAKDSQKIKKKTKIPRVTDEGWISQLSVPVEKKRMRRKNSSIPIQGSHQVQFPIGLYS